jgi:hypothetical protein
MVNDLIERTNNPDSGFYLHNYEELISKLKALDQSGQNVILIGVTYALLDLIEMQKFQLKNTMPLSKYWDVLIIVIFEAAI